MQNFRSTRARTLALAATALTLAACGTASKPLPSLRTDTAEHLAGGAHLMETHIPAGEFTIMSYQRAMAKGQPANIYIEDDGADGADHSLKGDPTPIDPVALRMAADDMSPNVIYLARPCQFVNTLGVRPCTAALYTTNRFSPQVLDAMNAALDNAKKNNNLGDLNLIGVGGGAAVAVELAAVRTDVKSLKFVGGTLDTSVLRPGPDKDGKTPPNPYSGSLNPIDAAPRVASIPQTFTVAGWDRQKSLTMMHNFQAAEGRQGGSYTIDPSTPDLASQPADKTDR